jgi:hypothetical protein
MSQTSLQKGFCIDTSALIEMTNHPQDIFGGLWDDLGLIADDGLLISPHEVYIEIGKEREESLQKWTKEHSRMFVKLDPDQIDMSKSIIKQYPKLIDPNKTIADADPFVIALAHGKGNWTLVTSESYSNNKFKPKIPNVCKDLNIKCIKLLDLCRECQLQYPQSNHHK